MNILKSKLKISCFYLCIVVFTFFITRLSLYFSCIDYFSSLSTKDILLSFLNGYKFDFSTKRGITKFKWNKEKPIYRLYVKQGMSIFNFWLLITKGKNSF